ncbi:MAG: hypothetical protein QXS20_04475 [Candidatus Thorarchaeota archaeon]
MKQERLTSIAGETERTAEAPQTCGLRRAIPTTFLEVDLRKFREDPLWPFLVEAVHRSPLFPNLLQYTREFIVSHEPEITPRDLACRLSISVGEALVILSDLNP